MFRNLSAVLAVWGCMFAAPAYAIVINFDALAVVDANQHSQGKSYTEKGFNFASSSTDYNFAIWGTLNDNFFGSTALWNGDGTGVNGVTTLTKVGGGAFDLLSIDLAELNLAGGGAAFVNFVATFSGGGTTSQNITLDGVRGTNNLSSFQTLNFTGFNDVVSVSWLQVGPYHQFDNVSVSAVPLPAALPLFAGGLGLLGLLGWRRKRTAVATA